MLSSHADRRSGPASRIHPAGRVAVSGQVREHGQGRGQEARAVDFAARVPQRIILIDGHELARLMVEHGVGVQTDQVITLVKLGEDFFE